MSPETIEVLSGVEFRSGLTVGAWATAVGGLLGLTWRRRHSRPAPVVGLLIVVSALIALRAAYGIPNSLIFGLVLQALAGWLFGLDETGARVAAALLAAAAAGMVVRSTGVVLPAATFWMLMSAIVVFSALIAQADHDLRDAAVMPALLVVSILGIFFAVPDTEEASVLLGAAIPTIFIGWPTRLASIGSAGTFPVIGLSMWTIVRGGHVRPAAMIGAAVCVGVLGALAFGWATPFEGGRSLGVIRVTGVLTMAMLHLGLVFLASRMVATRSPEHAWIGAVLLAVSAAVASRWLVVSQPDPAGDS